MADEKNPLSAAEQYMKKFYGTSAYKLNEDFRFQELSRVLTARLMRETPQYWNGHASMAIMRALYETQKTSLTQEFSELLKTTFDATPVLPDEKNVREAVRSIWMFPSTQYLEWCRVDAKTENVVSAAATKVLNAEKALKLHAERGKTVKIEVSGFVDKLWSIEGVSDTLTSACGVSLTKNTAPSHITLINSGVLADVDQKIFDAAFAGEASAVAADIDDIAVERVDHTFSFDYAPFWACAVVRLRSHKLDLMVKRLNQKLASVLKKPINPSFHITVAVAMR